MKKQSVKRGIWYISIRRKKQKGGAFPLAALAASILGNLAGIVLQKYLVVKYHDENDNNTDMVRDNILLRIPVNAKNVHLPD